MHALLIFMQPLSPICVRLLFLSSYESHPRICEASTFISILLTRIPRLVSHINDDRLWPHSSIAVALVVHRSASQCGLHLWLDRATSRFYIFRISSHWLRKKSCRSWLREDRNGSTIVSGVMTQRWLLVIIPSFCMKAWSDWYPLRGIHSYTVFGTAGKASHGMCTTRYIYTIDYINPMWCITI